MRKFVLLAALAALAAAGASQAFGGGKPFAQATGGVTLANPTQMLQFNAFDYGATGDRGVVNYTNVGVVSYQADVFCATVDSVAGTASFAYRIPAGNPSSGMYVVWHVTDGGSPGAGNDTAGFSVAADEASATTICQANGAPTSFYEIVGGNLVVH